MENPARTSALGPTVFFGLTAFTLITAQPVEPDYNPADAMDLEDIGRGAVQNAIGAPFTEVALPIGPPRARNMRSAPAMVPVGPAERVARADISAGPPAIFSDVDRWDALPTLSPFDVSILITSAPPSRGAPSVAPSGATADRAASADIPAGRPAVHDRIGRLAAPSALAHPAVKNLAAAAQPNRVTPSIATQARPDPQFVARPHAQFQVTGNHVNLRTGPGIWHPPVDQLNEGTRGLRIQTQGGWSQMRFFDQTPPLVGWMASNYLSPIDR